MTQKTDFPCGFNLYPYQIEGASFLASKRFCLLADEMGLGKTAQTIVALDRVHAERVLIICPSVAKHNWANEFSMWSWAKRNISVKVKLDDKIEPFETVICTFDYAAHNYQELCRQSFDCAVIDEGHFLKNPMAKRTKAILGKNGIAHNSKRIWLLTGTPAPNHAGELWTYLYTFGETTLSPDDFTQYYCHTQMRRYQGAPPTIKVLGTKKDKLPELKSMLKRVSLRRLKGDVMQTLPKIRYKNYYIEVDALTHEFMSETRSFMDYYLPDRRHRLVDKLKREDELINTIWRTIDNPYGEASLTAIQNISRSVSTLRKYLGLQKALKMKAEVDRFYNDDRRAGLNRKIVIFAIHRDVIAYLREELKEYGARTIYGGTPEAKKKKHIKDFQDPNNTKNKILICNIQAAGTAINLTAADNLWFVEMDWVPGNNAQAVMRVHRLGQTKDVTVRVYASKGTIDAQLHRTLRIKTKELTQIFDT